MPVDESGNTRRRREDDVDPVTKQRRARGEISCAECRRLKLKCDKHIPCNSCVRRGCPSICPNGTLSTGQGARYVLADTEHLHKKIAEMAQRIRQLEDALAVFQAEVSSETHPLLSDSLLSIKYGPEVHKEASNHGAVDETLEALGTLTINEDGEAKYYGHIAGSETLFTAASDLTDPSDVHGDESIPAMLMQLSNSFPFGTANAVDDALEALLLLLPAQPRAWTLCETYYEHGAWIMEHIRRDEFIDEILSPVYKYIKSLDGNMSGLSCPVSPHQLAVLYGIFSVGTLMDLTLPPMHPEARTYYHLCRAALSCRSVFESPDTSTVQGIMLMGMYVFFGGTPRMMSGAWAEASLALKLGQSIGFHRDSARWGLDQKTVNNRRSLFWESFMTDMFQSLGTGRPPSIRLSYVDCEFPEDDEQWLDTNGNRHAGYTRWKYEYCRDIFALVTEQILTAKPPSYQTILELDRKVRETAPPHMDITIDDPAASPSKCTRSHLNLWLRTICLTFIHRSYFAQALLDHPANPLRSPYAPSFLSAYQCSSAIVKSVVNLVKLMPDLCMRWSVVWNHLFTAALIVGSIATRAPASMMAPNAFSELCISVDLFERGVGHSPRARSGLPMLLKLRAKAFQVFDQSRTGGPQPSLDLDTDDGADELAIFGGRTRVLVAAILSKGPASSPKHSLPVRQPPSSPSSSASKGSSQRSSPSVCEDVPDYHPSLKDYLSYFPAPKTQQSAPQCIEMSSVAHGMGLIGSQVFADGPMLHNVQEPMSEWQHPTAFTTHTGLLPNQPISMAEASEMDALGAGASGARPPPVTDFSTIPTVMDEQWMSFMTGLFA